MGNVFQRSNLEGKLLNLVTELNQNEELEDGRLKAIVSGEMMSVERKFQDVHEIEPFAKHIILINHMPRISDYSDGLFRRKSIINLHRQFMGSSADPYLLDKLKGEMDAITSRALDALQRLIEGNGKFTQPESSHNAKLKWKADNNHVEQFISDCLYPLPNNQVGVQDMYDAYIEWFKTTGLRGQLGRKQFVYRMEALGIEKTTRNSGGYSFKEVRTAMSAQSVGCVLCAHKNETSNTTTNTSNCCNSFTRTYRKYTTYIPWPTPCEVAEKC